MLLLLLREYAKLPFSCQTLWYEIFYIQTSQIKKCIFLAFKEVMHKDKEVGWIIVLCLFPLDIQSDTLKLILVNPKKTAASDIAKQIAYSLFIVCFQYFEIVI